ncbi:hypothetical protein IHE44_0005318 [Lamprotornis superbus]|uniref:Uncharacterized protein n=1 Tax=Lamprotornis superbus TaxID=245042 RepID=A0A835NWH5_9PASS|nr:hypothetical protein IHE44_0005318 [Lamprotornis superbus]
MYAVPDSSTGSTVMLAGCVGAQSSGQLEIRYQHFQMVCKKLRGYKEKSCKLPPSSAFIVLEFLATFCFDQSKPNPTVFPLQTAGRSGLFSHCPHSPTGGEEEGKIFEDVLVVMVQTVIPSVYLMRGGYTAAVLPVPKDQTVKGLLQSHDGQLAKRNLIFDGIHKLYKLLGSETTILRLDDHIMIEDISAFENRMLMLDGMPAVRVKTELLESEQGTLVLLQKRLSIMDQTQKCNRKNQHYLATLQLGISVTHLPPPVQNRRYPAALSSMEPALPSRSLQYGTGVTQPAPSSRNRRYPAALSSMEPALPSRLPPVGTGVTQLLPPVGTGVTQPLSPVRKGARRAFLEDFGVLKLYMTKAKAFECYLMRLSQNSFDMTPWSPGPFAGSIPVFTAKTYISPNVHNYPDMDAVPLLLNNMKADPTEDSLSTDHFQTQTEPVDLSINKASRPASSPTVITSVSSAASVPSVLTPGPLVASASGVGGQQFLHIIHPVPPSSPMNLQSNKMSHVHRIPVVVQSVPVVYTAVRSPGNMNNTIVVPLLEDGRSHVKAQMDPRGLSPRQIKSDSDDDDLPNVTLDSVNETGSTALSIARAVQE